MEGGRSWDAPPPATPSRWSKAPGQQPEPSAPWGCVCGDGLGSANQGAGGFGAPGPKFQFLGLGQEGGRREVVGGLLMPSPGPSQYCSLSPPGLRSNPAAQAWCQAEALLSPGAESGLGPGSRTADNRGREPPAAQRRNRALDVGGPWRDRTPGPALQPTGLAGPHPSLESQSCPRPGFCLRCAVTATAETPPSDLLLRGPRDTRQTHSCTAVPLGRSSHMETHSILLRGLI